MSDHTIELAGRKLALESGTLAKQADGSACIRMGDTIVLATAVSSKPREGVDFFPLLVDFEAKMYAAGKIPGTRYIRREGRPAESSILTGRRIDRTLRPLFPEGYKDELQVVVTPLSADPENVLDIPGIIAASTALMISPVPFGGPVGAVRVGKIGDRFVINPTYQELDESELDLLIAGDKNGILMIEATGDEVPEEVFAEAIETARPCIADIIAAQEALVEKVGKEKAAFSQTEIPAEIVSAVEAISEELESALINPDKKAREAALEEKQKDIIEQMAESHPESAPEVKRAFEQQLSKVFRSLVLEKGKRPDGRALDEVREISCEVGLLPRAHGSGLFTRGQTQVLSTVTLGTVGDEQLIDDLGMEESKRYMHHYNFPPYSVGEVRPMRGPSRRDIGHGSLAERALLAVIPEEEEFPYTIRVVSDVLESNGSSSMASVCGSSLALMDGGVPIKSAVAGISIGMVREGDEYRLLTDIQGIEDHDGDMDFKVAGTVDGITAIQMDIKCQGLTQEMIVGAFAQAKRARLEIIEKMKATIPSPREELARHAPRIYTIEIDPAKIGAVIGTGGRVIRRIQTDYDVKIDIEDDGKVFIGATDAASAEAALNEIEYLTKEIEVDQVYNGKVVRTAPFGAFIELLPGRDGLLHISQIAQGRIERVEDVLNVGDTLEVRVIEVDQQGKVRLVRNDTPPPAPRGNGGGERHGRDDRRGGRGGDRRRR